MAQHYRLDFVLLPQGWAPDALVTVAEDGRISAIDAGGGAGGTGGPQEVERVSGFVVPGMPNAHSHAFQRGMTGNTEYRLSARDSFWTWRQAMYGLANRIEPENLQVLATQLFIEMLKAGYTSVAEFHYLHRRPAGDHYPDGIGLWDAIVAAAAASGIGLTLLPTLYQTSDFGAAPLKPEQARFASDTDWFLRAVEVRVATERSTAPAALRTGAAFHSLRAVPLETLREAARALRRIDPALPLHIHVAEQIQEVDSCKRHTGRRPLELLLETGLLDEHWCLVHATHATAAELQGIAATKATVCLSVTTEANLGDGFFEAARFLKLGGRLCVGSDSQATVCPAEELRWLEYQQRLRKKRRAVLADKRDPHVGTRLWRDAARHGAQAIGQPAGTIEVGRRADWLVLDGAHPSMAGSVPDNALDHLVFAGGSAAIRDVMVAGRWVVKDRRHAAEPLLRPRFVDLMKRLAS
ncbi:MAG TPA: formimidoylglutamate deiminase [Steroidobacteraceae bacterium]|nr:formimidoylglutamate deiminase [Steroidobacteraceae bacterium]